MNKLVFTDKKLGWYENPRLLRYIFSILFVASAVSIFEVFFVYYVSYPETEKAVTKIFPPVPAEPPVLRHIEKAEKRDRHTKNQYLIANFGIVILLMLFAMYAFYVKMGRVQREASVFGHNFRATVLQSLFSVAALLVFQVNFFAFGQRSMKSNLAGNAYAVSKGTLAAIEAELERRNVD